MPKQVLDVHQMQHLQELGLDTSNASMYWISYNGISVSIPRLYYMRCLHLAGRAGCAANRNKFWHKTFLATDRFI